LHTVPLISIKDVRGVGTRAIDPIASEGDSAIRTTWCYAMTPVVNLIPLKQWARRKLPQTTLLQLVLLAEDDELAGSDFAGRIGLWLRLANEEHREAWVS
jgi:hypothetical protein